MPRNRFLVAGMLILLSLTFTLAGSTPTKKPLGTWVREQGDQKVEFDFKTGSLRCLISSGGNSVTVQADYGISQDGVLFGRASKVAAVGVDNAPVEGHLFSFRFKLGKDTLTLSELRGVDNAEARTLIEGEYRKK